MRVAKAVVEATVRQHMRERGGFGVGTNTVISVTTKTSRLTYYQLGMETVCCVVINN